MNDPKTLARIAELREQLATLRATLAGLDAEQQMPKGMGVALLSLTWKLEALERNLAPRQ